MTRWVVCLYAVALGTLAAQPNPTELFSGQADVFVDSSGLSLLELPSEVLTQVTADLSDVRLFDAQGNEVPYSIDAGGSPLEDRNRFQPQVTALDRSTVEPERGQNTYRETYRLELPVNVSLPGQWTLEINTRTEEFVRRVNVDAVTVAAERTPLLQGAPFFHVPGTWAGRSHFELPRFPSHVIEVTIEGQAAGFLVPWFNLFQGPARPPRTAAETPLTILQRTDEPGRTELEIERPRALMPASLRFGTSTRTFVREVFVSDRAAGRRDEELSAARSGIFRVPAAVALEHLEVEVRAAQGDRLFVNILNRDSPPLQDLTVTAVAVRPALLFSMTPGVGDTAAGTLRFGGGRTEKPHYDLASLEAVMQAENTRGVSLEAPGGARLGPITENPNYAPQTLLSFASRPGAEIDPAAYSHTRPLQLEPSPEGLTRIELSVQDAAACRTDFADLRLIDSNSAQWPYLLDHNARQVWLPLALAATEDVDEGTQYRLDMPAQPATLDRLRLDFDSRFFDRLYQLFAVSEGAPERMIAVGRLARAETSEEPVEIEFGAIRATALRLVVSDGNDQPLPDPIVEGRFPLPDLYTVAPAGSYNLLLGYPDDQPPVYELAQASSTVLAARAGAATLGEVVENPLFSASSRLRTGPGSQRALFWIALLAAVGVLAVMTLKTVRGEAGDAS